jgi:hypothetical protein
MDVRANAQKPILLLAVMMRRIAKLRYVTSVLSGLDFYLFVGEAMERRHIHKFAPSLSHVAHVSKKPQSKKKISKNVM